MKAQSGRADLHAHILETLGRAVASGSYPEGTLLPREAELQEQFKASRQTVREAIKVLTAKGMIYARKRSGTFVRPRSSWDLLDPDVLAWHPAGELPHRVLADFVEMRRIIEPAAARFAAARGTDSEIAAIASALKRMHVSVGDTNQFYEADIEFHMCIFAASQNGVIGRLSAMLRPLLEASFRLQREASARSSLYGGYDVHLAVYEAISKRNPDQAASAMERLLDRAR